MTKQKIHAYRFGTPSLFSLKMVLTNARRDSPAHLSKKDVNEELALKLIEKLKTEYKKPLFLGG